MKQDSLTCSSAIGNATVAVEDLHQVAQLSRSHHHENDLQLETRFPDQSDSDPTAAACRVVAVAEITKYDL